MKTLLALFFLGSLAGRAAAEIIVERIPLTPPQIEELVSPIALYPDPLVALILPASTFPSDLVLAARYLERGGLPEAASNEQWDDSVRSLVRYREVIDYLDKNLEWTRRLGHCFLDQPDSVMDAIQAVRTRARSAGLLTDSAEQQVVYETDEIRILPTEPTVIYVPRYDPVYLYRPAYTSYYPGRPFITFGVGWTVGSWLNFDCDWRDRSVRIVQRPSYWYHTPNWRDQDRHQHFVHTPWTRRTSYPHHDRRFDRSPRTANYDGRGYDHRQASTPQGPEGRDRDGDRHTYDRNRADNDRAGNGNRSDHNRTDNYRSPSASPDRTRDGENRRRPEADPRSRETVAQPAVENDPPAAVAPATTQAVRAPRTYRRPDADTPTVTDRSRRPDEGRRDHRGESPGRFAQPRTESAPQVNRTRPTPPTTSSPARRDEATDRAAERRRDDSQETREQPQLREIPQIDR